MRVAYTHWFPCVPLGVAEEKQFWRDAGLQVELRGYQTSQEVIEALSAGEVDLGYDLLGSWIDVALRGVPISIVAETDWSHGGDRLLVRKGRNLRSLQGAPIAVYIRGSALQLFLREALGREQLALPDFPIVEVPEQEKALELFVSGKVDVVVTNEPWASRVAAAGAVAVASTADFGGVAPEGFAARLDRVDDATLQKFFTAWFRAVEFVHDPANARAVADTASVYAFAGAEAITPGDVAAYAKITPIHDRAAALENNDIERGNVRRLVQRVNVLRRLHGESASEAALVKLFHLDPVRSVASGDATESPRKNLTAGP